MTHEEENAIVSGAMEILKRRRQEADLVDEGQEEAKSGMIRFNGREKILIEHLRRFDEMTKQRISQLEADYGRLKTIHHRMILGLEAENRSLVRRLLVLEQERKRG